MLSPQHVMSEKSAIKDVRQVIAGLGLEDRIVANLAADHRTSDDARILL